MHSSLNTITFVWFNDNGFDYLNLLFLLWDSDLAMAEIHFEEGPTNPSCEVLCLVGLV